MKHIDSGSVVFVYQETFSNLGSMQSFSSINEKEVEKNFSAKKCSRKGSSQFKLVVIGSGYISFKEKWMWKASVSYWNRLQISAHSIYYFREREHF